MQTKINRTKYPVIVSLNENITNLMLLFKRQEATGALEFEIPRTQGEAGSVVVLLRSTGCWGYNTTLEQH
jgi:hypothetical protein